MGAEKAVNDTIFATLLHLPGITIVHIDIDEQGDCLIKAESTEKGTPCRWCGRTIHTPYGHGRELKIRHLSIFGRKTWLFGIFRSRYLQLKQCVMEFLCLPW